MITAITIVLMIHYSLWSQITRYASLLLICARCEVLCRSIWAALHWMYPRPPISVVTVLTSVFWVWVTWAGVFLQDTFLLTEGGCWGGRDSDVGPANDERLDRNEAFLESEGDARSEQVSDDEVVWLEARDSTDQELRSSDLGLWDFMVTLLSSVDTLYCIVSNSGSDL